MMSGRNIRHAFSSHDMLGFIDGTLTNPVENDDSKKKADYGDWKISNTLIREQIFDSLSENVKGTFVDPHTGPHTAKELWDKLRTTYSRSISDHDLMGHLENVIAWTAKINIDSHGSMGENIQFVEKLLEKISSESLLTLVNNSGMNALHVAAQVGNTAAAKMLVGKNKRLLFTADGNNYLPIHTAASGTQRNTFQYLLDASIEHIGLSTRLGCHHPFEDIMGGMLLTNVINAGFIDAAHTLMDMYPDMATKKNPNGSSPLSCIAKKQDLYYSGTRYNSYQRFVYSCVSVDKNRSGYMENQVTHTLNDLDKYSSYIHLDMPKDNQLTNETTVVATCWSCFKSGLL